MAYAQAGRFITVETPLGEDVLLLESLSGYEAVSQLFRFQLELLSDDDAIDGDQLLGQSVTVAVMQTDGTPRHINGLVSRFGQGESDARLTRFSMELVPWLWLLTRTADCRIFQNRTVPDVIESVFKDHGLRDYALRLQGSYAPREYCVQYRETDFNFVSRLMEQYGIFYFFEHEASKHTLVLADAPSAHRPCVSNAKARCEFSAAAVPEDDVVLEWHAAHELRSGTYTVGDFNFETPATSLLATVAGTLASNGNSTLEVYDYPGEYLRKAEGEGVAKVRIQEEEAAYARVIGRGTCRDFVSGSRFNLDGHFRDECNAAYILLEIEHAASAGSAYETRTGADDRAASYTNRFVCMPHAVPYRPPRVTPKPVVQGVQTAIVVGPKGEEIYTDKYGRVKVQFHWDREGKVDDKSSCWLRVAQGWAGKRWGSVFTPRIGQEVIVDFLEGDPDQPIITGRVYNAEQMPPYALPGEQTKSTLKTYSSKGGGGFNEIRFEDQKGSEQLFIHAERQQDTRVKKDSLEWVGQDRHLIAERDQLEEVKQDKHLRVRGDQNEQVDGSVSLKAGMDLQKKIGMKRALDAGMEIHLKAGMNIVIEAGLSITVKAGGGFIVVGPAGVTISGTPILMNAGGAAGAGSGASPDPPKAPLEADKAKPGEKSALPPAKVVSPQAIVLRDAASRGVPFCEKCAAAALARGATPEDAEEAAQEAGGADEEKTWIEIELVDDEGNPVPGEVFTLLLPDGTSKRGTLDSQGRARFDEIEAGTCELSFPNVDGEEWRKL